MKRTLLFLLLTIAMISTAPSAQAAFIIKTNTTITAHNSTVIKSATETSTAINSAVRNSPATAHMPMDRWANRGWIGIASVICGALGFLFPFFSFAAILLGFIGMGRRRNRNTGLAIAGLVLGLTVLLLVVFGTFTGFGLY